MTETTPILSRKYVVADGKTSCFFPASLNLLLWRIVFMSRRLLRYNCDFCIVKFQRAVFIKVMSFDVGILRLL